MLSRFLYSLCLRNDRVLCLRGYDVFCHSYNTDNKQSLLRKYFIRAGTEGKIIIDKGKISIALSSPVPASDNVEFPLGSKLESLFLYSDKDFCNWEFEDAYRCKTKYST